jgi:hypothetical protein
VHNVCKGTRPRSAYGAKVAEIIQRLKDLFTASCGIRRERGRGRSAGTTSDKDVQAGEPCTGQEKGRRQRERGARAGEAGVHDGALEADERENHVLGRKGYE